MKNTTGILKNKELKLMLIHLLSRSDVRIIGAVELPANRLDDFNVHNISFNVQKKQKHEKCT